MENPSSQAIRNVLSHWNMTSKVTFIRKMENFVYSIDGYNSILRITHHRHRKMEDLKAELNWMSFLQTQSIHVAHPIKNKNSQLIHQFEDDGEAYFAVVFKKAEGLPLSKKHHFTPEVIKSWGQIVGKLHEATRNSPTYVRPAWNQDAGFLTAQKESLSSPSHMAEYFSEKINWLNSLEKNKDCFGLIHADIHMGNFFVNKHNQITLFDFDDCHYHWFAYDIAVPIYSIMYFSELNGFNLDIDAIYENFINSYLATYSLDDQWIKKVPDFIKYRASLLYFWAQAMLNKNQIGEEHIEKAKAQMNWVAKFICQ